MGPHGDTSIGAVCLAEWLLQGEENKEERFFSKSVPLVHERFSVTFISTRRNIPFFRNSSFVMSATFRDDTLLFNVVSIERATSGLVRLSSCWNCMCLVDKQKFKSTQLKCLSICIFYLYYNNYALHIYRNFCWCTPTSKFLRSLRDMICW